MFMTYHGLVSSIILVTQGNEGFHGTTKTFKKPTKCNLILQGTASTTFLTSSSSSLSLTLKCSSTVSTVNTEAQITETHHQKESEHFSYGSLFFSSQFFKLQKICSTHKLLYVLHKHKIWHYFERSMSSLLGVSFLTSKMSKKTVSKGNVCSIIK